MRFFTWQINSSSLSDRGASKEPKNPLPECKDSSVSLTNQDPKDLFSKETQTPFSDSFGFKNPIVDFLKETHPKRCATPNIKIDIVFYSMVSVLPLSEYSHRKRHGSNLTLVKTISSNVDSILISMSVDFCVIGSFDSLYSIALWVLFSFVKYN